MLLRDFVNKKMASADKEASAEGLPLTLNNCKKHKPMRDLKIYGNSFQNGTPSPENPIEVQSVGELVTDEADANYGKYKIPVVQRGINLFNKNTVSAGYINDANGEYKHVSDYSSYASDYIEIAPNQKFYITSTPTHQWAAAYDENKQFVKGMYGYSSAKTMPSNAKYIRITVRADYIDTMQVQLGSVRTEYEPYIEPITTNIFLNEPLRKIGDYADFVDFKNKKVVRNIQKLDNELMINAHGINKYTNAGQGVNNCYRIRVLPFININPWNSRVFVCSNQLPFGGYIAKNKRTSIGQSELNYLYFRFDDEDDYGITDAKSCKEWLLQNDVDVYYVLKTPIEEPLNIELPKLNAKTSIIEVDTSLAPSNISGKYIKK